MSNVFELLFFNMGNYNYFKGRNLFRVFRDMYYFQKTRKFFQVKKVFFSTTGRDVTVEEFELLCGDKVQPDDIESEDTDSEWEEEKEG